MSQSRRATTLSPTAGKTPVLRVPTWTRTTLANGAELIVSEKHNLPLVSLSLTFIGNALSISIGFQLPLYLEEVLHFDAAKSGRWLAVLPGKWSSLDKLGADLAAARLHLGSVPAPCLQAAAPRRRRLPSARGSPGL